MVAAASVREMRPASERRVFLVPADKAAGFVRDYLGGRITDPSDPRDTGLQGFYPGVRQFAPSDLPRLMYARSGLFRRIIDKPAEDMWGRGWDVLADDPHIVEKARVVDERAGILDALEGAMKLARRDGWAIVRLRLRDSTGDPGVEPRGVRGVLLAEALSRDVVERIELDLDPDSDTFEEPLFYWLRTQEPTNYGPLAASHPTYTAAKATQSVRYHRDRVLFVVQHRKDGNRFDGDSVLSWLLADGHGLENVKWFATEGFAQRNVPLLKVVIDPEVPIDPDTSTGQAALKDLDDNVAKLQAGAIQRIRLQGADIQPIVGSERINPPDPYFRMYIESLSAGSGMPQSEFTGDPKGTLAAAGWDQKRYFGSISKDQNRVCAPLVRAWYARLDRWGLAQGLAKSIRGIAWPAHIEESKQERVSAMEASARTLALLRGEGLSVGPHFHAVFGWPEEYNPDEVQRPVAPAPAFPGFEHRHAPARARSGRPPAKHPDGREPARDLRIEVSPKLRRIEDRFQTAILDALRTWRAQAEDAVRAAAAERRFLRRNAPEDVARAIASLSFEGTDLEEIVRELLEEAADLGMMRTWRELGESGEVRAFVETGAPAHSLAEFARKYSAEKAAKATQRVRDIVAETIADGGGLAEIRENLRSEFGVLENETTIARTEAMRGYNHGSRAAMIEAGVTEWRWSAYAGADEECIALDGQVFRVDDVASLPPKHPNCRCVPEPLVEDA